MDVGSIIGEIGKGGLGGILIIMALLIALVYKILQKQNELNENRELRLSETITKNQDIILNLTDKIKVVEEVREEVRKQGNKLDNMDGDLKEIKNKLK